MKHLKLYIQTLLILETIDEIEEEGVAKKRLKLRLNQLKKEIENFDKDISKHTREFDIVPKLSEKINNILTEI